jgi:hypothetical protein
VTVLADLRDVVRHRWVLLVASPGSRSCARGRGAGDLDPVHAILTGGHAIWLAYGIGIANLPLIVTDSVGLCCGLLTWITAVRLRRRHLPREAIPDSA